MPKYDYECEYCGEFELTVPADKRDEQYCPGCGRKLGRIFEAADCIYVPVNMRATDPMDWDYHDN